MLSDLKVNYGKCDRKPNIYKGSCLDFNKFFSDEIELTFFTPLIVIALTILRYIKLSFGLVTLFLTRRNLKITKHRF